MPVAAVWRAGPWRQSPCSRSASGARRPALPFTYLGDFARGLATLGTHDEAFGQVWHVPSAETLTTRGFIDLVYEAAGSPTRLSVIPPALLGLLALVSPMLRADREQQYQRDRSWVVDHTKFARMFGADVTPHADAVALTLAWWRREGQAPTPVPPPQSDPASA